jgi:hypothetical protein
MLPRRNESKQLKRKLLVNDPVQRTSLLSSQRSEALFPGHQEQESQTQPRRLAYALRQRKTAGRGERVELPSRAERAFLALHPRLLGQARHS